MLVLPECTAESTSCLPTWLWLASWLVKGWGYCDPVGMATVCCTVQFHHGVLRCLQQNPLMSRAWRLVFFVEAITNSSCYDPFLEDRTLLPTGLRRYILDRHYDQSVGDIVPTIIANALQVKVDIVNVSSTGSYDVLSICPTSCLSHTGQIMVHRDGDHFNGLVRDAEPFFLRKIITYRHWKGVDPELFQNTIRQSDLFLFPYSTCYVSDLAW